MGRMADLWKTADRGPATPLPTPGALLTLDAAAAEVAVPEPIDDDDVPFIEVGGPRPIMHHLEPPTPISERGIRSSECQSPSSAIDANTDRKARDSALRTSNSALDSVMTVRFGAVHADQRAAATLGPEIVAFHRPDHTVSMQYRSLIAEIAAQLPGTKPRAILVAATQESVGASTIVLNLGVTLARHNEQRVTLIDANAERPELAAKLGMSASPGLRDVVVRGTPPAWSVRETIQPRLFALTSERGDAPMIPALSSAIEQLRSRNDWVIVDAGCWHIRLMPLAESCDATYLVHADPDATAQDMIAAILNATGRLRGCIITRR